MFEIKDVTQLVTGLENRINIVLGVCCTDTESHSRRNEWGGGVCDDDHDNRCLPSAHHSSKGSHLARVVDQKGNNGGEWVAIGDEPKLLEARMEIPGVESQAADAHASF